MKQVPTFQQFTTLNEGILDFKVEREIALAGLTFSEDDVDPDLVDELMSQRDNVGVWGARDRRTGDEWVIIASVKGPGFLEIRKNDDVLYSHDYPSSQKNYYEQDCMNSLGFKP